MTPREKAQDLINQFLDENDPKRIANKICDEIIEVRKKEMCELIKEFNLSKIESKLVDYYLKVKNEIKAI